MMAGEPSIGKTRPAQELVSQTTSLGAQTLWGWCYEQEGAPAYWPWVQPMRSYIQDTDSKVLGAQLGPGAADLCEIIPEVRDKLPGLEPASPLEPEQARFRLFDSITTFLKNVAQSQSLVLVLDDLQWADQPFLLLLEFLARQVPDSKIMLVGTYRDVEVHRTHPLSNTLAQLGRSPAYHREKLTGLLKEALPIATELGMLPLMERVTTLQERADAKPVQAPAYPDGLSAREVEVLRLMRRRQEQPGDRRRAIHQPQYRGAPRKQHS